MKKNLFKSLIFVQVILCATMLVSCDNSAEWEAKMQKAIGKGDFTEARACAANIKYNDEAYKKITRAQIAFLINTGSFEQAYSLSQEENVVYVYFELFMPKLIDVYESKGKADVLKNLALVQFENTPDLSERSITYTWNSCAKYNKEAIKYNTILEQFIDYLDISDNRDFAVMVTRFIKPVVVDLPWEDGNSTGVELSNQLQEDIKKKLNL